MHPLHPASVHLPVACILATPFADLAAHLFSPDAWQFGALTSAGGVIFGLIAASFGALDFERAHARAPRTVIAHACAMLLAVSLEAISLSGRIGSDFAVVGTPPAWSLVTGAAAALVLLAGAYLGGELVYTHGVNVRGAPAKDR
jgi:uncharacterized membrane protein